MLKSLLMRPQNCKKLKNFNFSIRYDYFKLFLHNALTNWSTVFVNVHKMTQVQIPVLAAKRHLG